MGQLIYGRFAPPLNDATQKDAIAVTNFAKGLLDAYRVAQPADIVHLLQQVQLQRRSVLMVLPSGAEVVTMLLAVNPISGEFIYECGRNRAEKQAVLSARQIQFITDIEGVEIRFTADAPAQTLFAQAPAFLSPLPSRMLRFQRREYYRTSVKLSHSCPCTIQLPDSTNLSLHIRDISLGGVKLQSTAIAPQMLSPGALVREAVLDFLGLGNVEVTMRVVAHRHSSDQRVWNHLYGCQFQQLPRSKEAALERLIFSLERIRRAKTLRQMSSSLQTGPSRS